MQFLFQRIVVIFVSIAKVRGGEKLDYGPSPHKLEVRIGLRIGAMTEFGAQSWMQPLHMYTTKGSQYLL